MPDVNDLEKFGANLDKKLDQIDQNYSPPLRMKFLNKLRLILFQPKLFYEEIKDLETNFFGALRYIVIFLGFFSVFRIISFEYQSISGVIDIFMILFNSFFMFTIFCMGLVTYLFLLTGILHFIVKIIGGQFLYYQTFKAFVYGFTPILLIGWIPHMSILIPILLYSFVLQIVGIAKLQEISYLKAILASVWLPFATLYFFNFLTAS